MQISRKSTPNIEKNTHLLRQQAQLPKEAAAGARRWLVRKPLKNAVYTCALHRLKARLKLSNCLWKKVPAWSRLFSVAMFTILGYYGPARLVILGFGLVMGPDICRSSPKKKTASRNQMKTKQGWKTQSEVTFKSASSRENLQFSR